MRVLQDDFPGSYCEWAKSKGAESTCTLVQTYCCKATCQNASTTALCITFGCATALKPCMAVEYIQFCTCRRLCDPDGRSRPLQRGSAGLPSCLSTCIHDGINSSTECSHQQCRSSMKLDCTRLDRHRTIQTENVVWHLKQHSTDPLELHQLALPSQFEYFALRLLL